MFTKKPLLQSSKGVHSKSAHTELITGATELNMDGQNSLYQLKILSEFRFEHSELNLNPLAFALAYTVLIAKKDNFKKSLN